MEQLLTIGLFLVIGHFIADYVFQTDAIAIGKNNKINHSHLTVPWYYWMLTHSMVHGLAVYLITNSVILLLAEVFAHFLIDFSKCRGWIGLHTDQILHISCKIAYIAVLFSWSIQ